MSKKDYVEIAKAIANATYRNCGGQRIDRQRLVKGLSDYFAEDSDRFDEDKFTNACYKGVK